MIDDEMRRLDARVTYEMPLIWWCLIGFSIVYITQPAWVILGRGITLGLLINSASHILLRGVIIGAVIFAVGLVTRTIARWLILRRYPTLYDFEKS